MTPSKAILALTCAAATLCLSACGGGTNATVGGYLSGLGSGLSVTLQDNSADNLTLVNNGTFTFPTSIASSSVYNATVLTQPVGQACVVTNGSGTVDTNADPVTTIAVTCTSTASIIGTISGLVAGASVTLIDGTALPAARVATNGAFAFQGTLPVGSVYTVTVSQQPAVGSCVVTNGTGTIPSTGVVSVTVTCS
jgi:hypothetical protein